MLTLTCVVHLEIIELVSHIFGPGVHFLVFLAVMHVKYVFN
jgi:hypothetical protein